MSLTILGAHPLETDADGKLKSRIGTLFVDDNVLVTLPRMTHAMQRLHYRDHVNRTRAEAGRPPLADEDVYALWDTAVDLIMEGRDVLIRPEADRMDLAFRADESLQTLLSKVRLRFLHARHPAVQKAIRERGEYWRISAQPESPEEVVRALARARIAISGQPIYYYSTATGTRYLTVQAFAELGRLDTPELRFHLAEIRDYAARRNRGHHPEIAFFAADARVDAACFAEQDPERLPAKALRAWHAALTERFRAAVPAELQADNPDDPVWRNRLFACLTDERNETLAETVVSGLTPEFFRQVHWFPGGRVEDGELMFDPIFDELNEHPDDPELARLCDPRVKGFIFNYVREFGGLQYVNIGGLLPGLRKRPARGGHRAYLAEIKHRGADKPLLRILRIQQWGIRQHLDQGKELLRAIMEAQDYTEYTLDRRLGCWELGMPLPGRIDTRTVAETYYWKAGESHATRIWTTYYEREFIEGLPTDKLTAARLADKPFALRVARLLGQAAAPNLAVGRTTDSGEVIFDNGDEMLLMDEQDHPQRLVVADHAGTFNDYVSPLETFARGYAQPVVGRRDKLADLAAFADAYLDAMQERLLEMQADYRQRRRAFDTLFQHSKQGDKTFSCRWACALARLDATDVPALVARVREAIRAEAGP